MSSEQPYQIEPEPDDIVGRLRYWGRSRSRARRAYATGDHMRLFNEAADALEASQQENERLREFLNDIGYPDTAINVILDAAEVVDALEEQEAQGEQ